MTHLPVENLWPQKSTRVKGWNVDTQDLVRPDNKPKDEVDEDKGSHEGSHDGIAQSNNQHIQMIGILQETGRKHIRV